MPTATTRSNPPASMQVQSTLTHMDSRFPLSTKPMRSRRNPRASSVTVPSPLPIRPARLAAKTRDCVATDVTAEQATANPTAKPMSGER